MEIFEHQRDRAIDAQAPQEAGQRVEKSPPGRPHVVFGGDTGQMAVDLGCQPAQLDCHVGQQLPHRPRRTGGQQTVQRLGERRIRHARVGRRTAHQHRDPVFGQRSGDLGNQSRLAGPRFTADEHRLTVTAFHPFPGLLEYREFCVAAHHRTAATGDQLGWKRWLHPLRHGVKVIAVSRPVDSQT